MREAVSASRTRRSEGGRYQETSDSGARVRMVPARIRNRGRNKVVGGARGIAVRCIFPIRQ